MQIGSLAKKAGVSVQTVRFYERSRLLPAPPRKESGYRVYSDQDLRRLLFIRQAKALGFSLDEIRTVLNMRERGQCPCASVLHLAGQHLASIERQLRQLSAFRDELRVSIKRWKQSGRPQLSADAFCVLIENTMSDGLPHGKTKGKQAR
ncbi:MAG TPA: heavy metal-responsive transcriptional regulator [Terriglobia bacterium]|jgi:DNA-binding transcriptional MerR regulator|nr:heavy metal-responsive transcriptional regulator [Terriglobia bacterium]